MGYYVSMDIGGVVIPADKVADCLAAINQMFNDENLSNNAGGGAGGPSITEKTPVREKRWYSWVTNPRGDGFEALQDALIAWRYDVEINTDGSINIGHFTGEKLGDDEQLFEVIAPFVQSGGVIECRGEDNAFWRYLFENGELIEQQGEIVYR